MKKNFLITTGGSGGHVIPATIFYDHLLKEANLIITTDKRGLKYLDKSIYNHEIIDTPRLNNIWFLPINFFKILFLIFKSFFLLKNKKIEQIFSTGGYMSLPLIFAGRLLNLKIYLIEPNQVLGRANKFFLSFSEKIFCYNLKIKNFPKNFKDKMIIISPLVKKNIYNFNLFSHTNKKFTLLAVGGSQGANFFDNNLKDIIIKISKKTPIKVIQQTNENNISSLSNFYSNYNVENKLFSFEKNFFQNIQQADLCITRAGASTLAELSVMNTPFIAIPLPTSKDNHQFENAKFYEDNGCCWVVEQDHFKEKTEEILNQILSDKTDFLIKKDNLKKFNYQNSWIDVNQKILEIINEN